jgi:hypothetical protein
LPDDHSGLEPPDPIPNSAVKQTSADGSVASAHVRVGHRQAPNTKNPRGFADGGFLLPVKK